MQVTCVRRTAPRSDISTSMKWSDGPQRAGMAVSLLCPGCCRTVPGFWLLSSSCRFQDSVRSGPGVMTAGTPCSTLLGLVNLGGSPVGRGAKGAVSCHTGFCSFPRLLEVSRSIWEGEAVRWPQYLGVSSQSLRESP